MIYKVIKAYVELMKPKYRDPFSMAGALGKVFPHAPFSDLLKVAFEHFSVPTAKKNILRYIADTTELFTNAPYLYWDAPQKYMYKVKVSFRDAKTGIKYEFHRRVYTNKAVKRSTLDRRAGEVLSEMLEHYSESVPHATHLEFEIEGVYRKYE